MTVEEDKTEGIPKKCQGINCKKKIKFIHYKCRCGKYYCINHANAEAHNCEFDYKGSRDISGMVESMKCVSKKVDVI